MGGYGFGSLEPILTIWTLSRNLSYLLFAIFFVVAGTMIIFRVKIDAKTAVSLQNALPNIIRALVLVTFSYAIAGFLIDLMWTLTLMILNLARGLAPNLPAITLIIDQVGNGTGSIFTIAIPAFTTAFQASQAIGKFLAGMPGMDVVLTVISLAFLQNNLIPLLQGQDPRVFWATSIAGLIIALALGWALIKTWFALISAYINIVLGVIFAPLRLALGAIPGQNQFMPWLTDLLANLLAFPAVLIIVLITTYISNQKFEGGFVPPLLGSTGDLTNIQSMVALGLLLTIPKMVEILREMFKSPAFKYGSAWSEATGWSSGQAKKYGGLGATGLVEATLPGGKRGILETIARLAVGLKP